MIRCLFIIFLMLIPANAMARIDYQLEVQLFPEEHRLIATAVIDPDESLPQKIDLRLAKTCEIIAIHQAGKRLDSTFNDGRLTIELSNYAPVSISYRGRFTDQVDSTVLHNEDPSYGVTAGISVAGTFLSAAADWYPRLNSEDIRYRLRVTAPLGIEAITSGRRIERNSGQTQTHSSWEIDYPLSGLTLSAAPFRVFENLAGRVPIYAYFYPESVDLAAGYLQQARNYLRLYEQLFGPYPFHKFAIVENFFPTGYGFPSWTLLGSSVIRLPFIIKTSLGHEIAHSWWGTGVRVDYAQGNWAEGLTTYVADYLYKEQTSEAAAREYRLKILRDYTRLVGAKNDFPLSRFLSRNDKASQAIGYGKAAMLFNMLRRQVGDQIFWAGLREIAQKKMFKTIGWIDFAEQFSAASSRNMSPFFEQWLQRKSGPTISLQQVLLEKGDGYLIRGSLDQTAPYYQLTVALQVVTEKETHSVPINLNGKSQDFILHSTEPPTALIADPNADLFRILAVEEIPPATNAVRGSTNLLIIKADNYTPSARAIKTLLGALRKENIPVKNLAEVSASELAAHDLLIFGVSDQLKPGVLSAGKINLPGKAADMTKKSAFVVLPHPTAQDRIAAWFISADSENDAVVARKIPHYGKYSYLLFEGATNRLKGTFPPEKSPLKIDFIGSGVN